MRFDGVSFADEILCVCVCMFEFILNGSIYLHTVVMVCVLWRALLPVVLECPWVACWCPVESFLSRLRETEFFEVFELTVCTTFADLFFITHLEQHAQLPRGRHSKKRVFFSI